MLIAIDKNSLLKTINLIKDNQQDVQASDKMLQLKKKKN
jgi:hypothetical protein